MPTEHPSFVHTGVCDDGVARRVPLFGAERYRGLVGRWEPLAQVTDGAVAAQHGTGRPASCRLHSLHGRCFLPDVIPRVFLTFPFEDVR